MSAGRARQDLLLAPATTLLRHVVAEHDADPSAARDVLDAAASQIGGFDLDGYRHLLGLDARLDSAAASAWAGKLLDLIEGSGIPRRLALATLAQPEVTEPRRRTTGAYYTDFRLARYLARRIAHLGTLTPQSTVVDTAAGTGVLLVALAEQIGREDPGALRDLVAHGLSAVDLDPECRRGTMTALASLTADLGAVCAVARRIQTADSLLVDAALWPQLHHPGRFDVVIGNPPWERLRVTRHETLVAAGAPRHYGADYEADRDAGAPPAGAPPAGALHSQAADRLRRYASDLATRYPLLGDREIDLCQAFLALGWALVRPGGSLGMLLPAGLIRAEGTRRLREHLLTNAADVDLTVLHNRGRFFGIDTRFKFLAVCARVAEGDAAGGATIRLRHADDLGPGVPEPPPVRITFDDLAVARGDLTVPEVASARAWQLFQHLTVRGSRPDQAGSPWAMRITREVDMTRDRALFHRTDANAGLPVVEGRMIQQYRSRAKTYVTGTGRAAIWQAVPLGEAGRARPQFAVDPARLPAAVRERTARPRIGFCDIVGQTNERTVQAALVAAGRVCGNKVPTIDFLAAGEGELRQREMLFLAAANSLVVDWFVRRVVTTSLNFFILRGVPLPPIDPGSPMGTRLVALAEQLVAAETVPDISTREAAEHRAEIDLLMLRAYRIELTDLPVLLADFPLLDRRQPALPGEARSTVTADLLTGLGGDARAWDRYRAAASLGALAYVPEEFAQADPG